jgi:hypothetical protein
LKDVTAGSAASAANFGKIVPLTAFASDERCEELGHRFGDQLDRAQVAPILAPVSRAGPDMSVLVGALNYERGWFCGFSIHRAHNPRGRDKFSILT